jgi:hypothetical protein
MEGHVILPKECRFFLDKLNALEPQIQGVFHKYVKEQIYKTRVLTTPFGRERQFLGLRPNADNYSVLNEAYSFIPQSVVGDNTGFAVYFLETELPLEKRAIIQEGHDSIVQDIPDSTSSIWFYLSRTMESFVRRIRFHNGIEVEIPIEAEIGYDFNTTVKIKDMSLDGVLQAYEELQEKIQELKEKEEVEDEELEAEFK